MSLGGIFPLQIDRGDKSEIFVQLRGTYYFVIMGLEHCLDHYHELFESFMHNSIMLKKRVF